jgi:hypothetical protein
MIIAQNEVMTRGLDLLEMLFYIGDAFKILRDIGYHNHSVIAASPPTLLHTSSLHIFHLISSSMFHRRRRHLRLQR